MPSYAAEEVDLCVVGSGAGGAPIALELSGAGASVVVLEKGRWLQDKDFHHDEIENTHRDRWVPFLSDEPHMLARAGAPPVPSSDGWIANCVGGGTVHMAGFFYRMHPQDFALRTRYGDLKGANLADWPIGYRDLAPYYDRVEAEIGVSGKAGQYPNEPPRSGDYPLPPVKENPLARLIDQGCKGLGLHPFTTPRAIASRPYRGRSACIYCNFCGSYGCEVGAKGSTLAALLPRALATGKCELRPRSMAFRIECGKDGRARAVHYYDADGNEQVQRAKRVVLSATSVESARLLLNSSSSRFPKGLANGSGLVGKNLTFSTQAKAWAEFPLDRLPKELRPHHRVHFLQRSVQDYYFIEAHKGGYDKGGTLTFQLPHRQPIFNADRISKKHQPPLWGAELQHALKRHYTELRELEVEIFSEYLPTDGTHVKLSADTKDRWGIPVAQIHVQHHPENLKASSYLLERAIEIFKAAGAESTGREQQGNTAFVLQHGSCRFGTDPASSVLDAGCRAHEVDNLYVVDGSFMPSSGGVPTTLTIMANAFRVADGLKRELKG